ncbi:Eukaryotic translation initiation factor 3 subunit B [Paramicrosporidium saccamoebae]|uniref:Eukaryotic translation initiation factor 3 subunit B n=1 Tax=Paramicrosporidium saccamoebae TaxID=1246581 RepID=A0A2H9TI15_9FUNG|nr:Eukaryotic translation initiation factor 3 subunit B [Paramicrosporidium saccamoebae]
MTVEDIEGIKVDFSDLEAAHQVELDTSLDTVLIISNLPKIDCNKEEKLLAVLRKNLFTLAKATPLPESICMPRDESQMSKGYMFVEFAGAEEASAVLQVAHGYRLDKQHVLSAVRLSDFERLLNMEDEYKEPTIEPFEEKEYLKSWLNDTTARDQFVTLAGTTASVFSNARGGAPPELVHTRANWTDTYVQWSPRGSYLATVHGPGIMLWGGASFSRLGKYPHQNVKLVNFSSTETIMVTWSPYDELRPTEPNLLVWDVVAGKLVRGFVADEKDAGGNTPSTVLWPMVKFSYDDKYAARVHEGALHIYEMATFTLLDKKSHKIEGLKDFSWSPVDHMMVHWTQGTEDIPARVSVMSVPSKTILRSKNLFNVNTCQVHWHARGDYLCVQVERHSKNKKQIFSNLELFRLREKGIPVDCLEFKEPLITSFAWEPEGDRFLAAGTHEFKTTISFYTMKAHENGMPVVKLLSSVERKTLNRFLWSPRGEFVLFVGTDSTSAMLEFFSAQEMTTLATREHFLATDAAWDPSGRFVSSWVSAWKQSSDHGFIIWDMRGEQVARLNTSRMSHFAWRPRPPTLLSRDQQREIRRNLKDYASKFEEADLRELSRESSNTAELKSRLMNLWNEWRRHCQREYDVRTVTRKALIGAEDEFAREQLTTTTAEWIEEVIEESETVEESES